MSKPKWLEFRGVDKVKLALQQRVNWLLQNHSVNSLDDVTLTNIANGQVLKYDSTTSKFVNADESGGTEVEANPSGTATDTLSTIDIDGTVYDIAGGGGSGTASIEKIWDYVTNNNGTIPYDTYTVTLSKSINNYDVIVVEVVSWYDDLSSVDWGQTFQFTINVNALKNAYKPYYFNYTSYDDRATGYHVEGTTFECVAYNLNYTNGLVRVWGVKSGGGTGGTSVEANPTGPPTDTLSKIDIDGTIYDLGTSADKVSYDNTTSGLTADDVQEAIDELESTKADTSDIPTVNNNTVIIQKNGTTVDSFTLNQSGDKTVNIQMSKSDVGLGNVPNVSTNDQTPTFTQASTRANIASGEKLSVILGKIMKWFADLKTVAFTNSYTDLDNKPDINNATLNIKKNGTSQGTFTANASTDVNVDISVPTKTSDLTNDSGFTTNTGTVTKVSTGNGLTGGDITTSGTIKTYVPRVVADCNRFVGGQYSISWEEYTMGASYNLPNNDWYHIISIQGEDTRFGTQLALAMTNNNGTEGAYYRRMANNVWTEWYSLTIDHSKVNKAGDSMTGNLQMLGKDLMLKTVGSNSNDSGDITWYYGNGREKARFWTADTYSTALGINYRVYNESGAKLYEGTIPLQDTTYTADGVYLGLSNNKFTKRIVETGQSSQATWYKICTINITNRYGYGGVLLTIRGEGRTDGLAPYIKILCRMKQQNAMTNDPHLSLNAIEWLWFDPSNVKAFLTANTESQKTLEVWVRSAAGYQSLRTIVEDYVGAIEWVYQSGTLPDITAIETGTYGRVGGAKSLMFVGSQNNEIRFDSDTKPSTPLDIYVGYKWSNDTFDAKISGYRFCNGNGDNLVPLYCSSGSIASGNTKAVTGGAVYDKLSGISTGISGMTFQKAGKIVEIDTYGVSYSSLHSATIPNKFKPHITMGYLSIAGYIRRASDSKCQVAFLTYDYFPSDKLDVFIIDSNGEMTSPSNNDEVFITGTYFTDNLDY